MGASIEPTDIGTCRSLKIRCISETSWFDTEQLLDRLSDRGLVGLGVHLEGVPVMVDLGVALL